VTNKRRKFETGFFEENEFERSLYLTLILIFGCLCDFNG